VTADSDGKMGLTRLSHQLIRNTNRLSGKNEFLPGAALQLQIANFGIGKNFLSSEIC
jgi:hypothetical protein